LTQIDIALDPRLTNLLSKPVCVHLPEPGSVSLTLPSGAKLKGIGDLTKGIPTDCSLSFSLLLQLGPVLANFECLVKILKLIKPLMDIINGLPVPPAQAILEFGKAAGEVMECVTAFTGAGMFSFVKDLLLLLIKILKCLVQQFESIAQLMSGLALQIKSAEGNPELLETLQCAQENAAISAAAAGKAFEPIGALLELAAPLLEIAGVSGIEVPTLGAGADPAALAATVETLKGLVDTLQLAADAIPGGG
jgi:hypothetical protein